MARLFPDVEEVFSYGMHGWKVPRRKTVESRTGTMDPNWLFIGLAERAAGITLHVWNPLDWQGLKAHRAQFEAAGFKVMVGCLQFNRKSEFPVDVVDAMVARIAKAMDAERRT